MHFASASVIVASLIAALWTVGPETRLHASKAPFVFDCCLDHNCRGSTKLHCLGE